MKEKAKPMRKQPRPPRTKEQISADTKVLQEKLGRTKQPRPKPKPKPKQESTNSNSNSNSDFDNRVPPEKPQGPIRTDLENKLLLEKLEEMMSTPQKRAWLMPAAFCQYASRGKWVIAPHLQLLNQYLMAVAGGQLKRLIINLPPRHGKSEMVSKYFPVWFLGRYPDKNVLFASYESDFAASWGQKARDCMQEHGREIFNLSVHPTVASASRWGLNHRTGEMKTAGAGAGLTGKGADLMIIDDIIKGAETALSKTQRDKIWSWYQSECFTRLEPGGSIILIQTRWNADDLTGRVLEQAKITGEDWFILNLPAIAEENDILGRKVGEPLWPERYPLKELEKIQKSVGSYWWASLYQQRPSPAEGGILKKIWFRYYTRPPTTFDEVILSCDLAFKDLKNSAYVVLQIWGRLGADKYLIAQVRAKMDFPTTVKAIRDICSQYPEAKVKLIEEAANGAAVISTLKHEISGIIPILAHGSKEARVHAISSQIEAGNVFLPELAYWVEDFVEECATFPNGLYMDQVDAMSQALFRLGDSRRVVLITPEGDLGKTSTFKAPTYDFDDVEQNPGEFKDDLRKVSQWKTIIPY